MKNSAVILAGGFSRRFGKNKGLIDLVGKPLILYVFDRISDLVDETVAVVGSQVQKEELETLFDNKANVVVDKHEAQGPLVGALTGFESVKSEYSLLLPCDTPFISKKITQFLLEICVNRGAAIPRWPSGYIEPLQAVYQTKPAITAAKKALEQSELDLRAMIKRLMGVRYISTVVLREMDPRLLTFFNVNTTMDLRKAESLLK